MKKDAELNRIVQNILIEDNLKVNETKTEHTTIVRKERKDEEWRTVKKLGSLLGDSEDIARRKQLSIVYALLDNITNLIGDISNFSDDELTNLLLYGDNIHSIEVNASILKNTLIFLKSSERFGVPLL